MASASDIPRKYDVVVNSEGYVFADVETQKAVLGYSSPFVARTALQGNAYGDSETEFFQVFTQKDWSKGEQQKFQSRDEEGVSRYWQGTNIDVSVGGQASLRPLTAQTSAFGSAVTEMTVNSSGSIIFAAGADNLYSINAAGTVTDHGAHGLAGAENACASMSAGGEDGNAFLADSGDIRRWNGSAFSTFSTTGATSIAYLNNALYAIDSNTGNLIRYDTAGAATTLFTWRNAAGAAVTSVTKLVAFGGKLLILRSFMEEGSEVWLYDGTAPARIWNLAGGFTALDIAVVQGVIMVGGYFEKRLSSGTYRKPAIFYYSGGTTGKLWEAHSFVASASSREARLAGFQGGLLFTDDTRGQFMFYDPALGGVSTIGTYTFTDATPRLAATSLFALHTRAATTPWRHPADGFSTSGTVTTSLIDFDSSLNKRFRGIEVEFDAGTGGNGGSVDIAYRVGDVDGSYTSLVTGATSGSENLLTNISGKSISVKVTINLGTSTNQGPVLKRIKVRAVPVRPSFRKDKYVLNCQGRDGNNIKLRDGSTHTKDGKSMATDLRTAATATNPITIIDTFGSYTGVIESLELVEVRPEEFLAVLQVREV